MNNKFLIKAKQSRAITLVLRVSGNNQPLLRMVNGDPRMGNVSAVSGIIVL